jgi:hypothetical protein
MNELIYNKNIKQILEKTDIKYKKKDYDGYINGSGFHITDKKPTISNSLTIVVNEQEALISELREEIKELKLEIETLKAMNDC